MADCKPASEKIRKYFCDWCGARWEELSTSDEEQKQCLACGSLDCQLFPETRDFVNPQCAEKNSSANNQTDCGSCTSSCQNCPLI